MKSCRPAGAADSLFRYAERTLNSGVSPWEVPNDSIWSVFDP